MKPDHIDLSPLDPAADRVAYERWIRRIVEGAAPELARRAGETGPLTLLVGWARPTLAAAATIAALAAGALFMTDRPANHSDSSTVVDALGVPAPAADWLESGREPDQHDLVLAMERR